MGQTHQANVHYLVNDSRLATAFEVLDELHSAAADGRLHLLTTMTQRELLGWLRDLMYTAQETIEEIEDRMERQAPPLRLIK